MSIFTSTEQNIYIDISVGCAQRCEEAYLTNLKTIANTIQPFNIVKYIQPQRFFLFSFSVDNSTQTQILYI